MEAVRTGEATPALETRKVSMAFAGLVALSEIDLEIRRGEILGLIGANGAGKTTLVNVVTGHQRPTAGTVLLDGEEITSLPPHLRARRGLTRTFQGVRIFSRMTVAENVEVAAIGSGMRRRKARQRCAEVLSLVEIAHLSDVEAAALSYGDSQRVGIARAVVSAPKVVAIDEPAAGMNEQEGEKLLELVAGLRDREGISFLLIEHNVEFVMRLCDRIHVLGEGETIAVGSPAEIQRDPAVIRSYLGSEHVVVNA